MGQSSSSAEKANDENGSSRADESFASVPSVDGLNLKSPKNKTKVKTGNKKRKGSDEFSSDGHLAAPSTPRSILTGSRRESMTSNISCVSERVEEEEEAMKIETYNNSPKKYRTFPRRTPARPNPEPKTVEAEVKVKAKAEVNGSFEMLPSEVPEESFVVVPSALEVFDTDQKLGDIPCVENSLSTHSKVGFSNAPGGTSQSRVTAPSDTRQAKLQFFNANPPPVSNEPGRTLNHGIRSAPHVQVSISKQIQLREGLPTDSEADVDHQYSLPGAGNPGVNNHAGKAGNPGAAGASNPHGKPNNPNVKDHRGNPGQDAADCESLRSGKSGAMLDLSQVVHADKTGALGEKLQRSVSDVNSRPGWQSTDLDHHSRSGKKPASLTPVTPNTKANNRRAELYGTLPRNQMPTGRQLIPRGGIKQTNLDEFEISKSADALHEMGTEDEPVAARKVLFSQRRDGAGVSSAAKQASDLSCDVVTDAAADLSFIDSDSSAVVSVKVTKVSTTPPESGRASNTSPKQPVDHDSTAAATYDVNDPDLDIYSAGAKMPEQERQSKERPGIAAAVREKPKSVAKPKIMNVGEKRQIRGYGEREWKGQTPNARAMRNGYAQIPTLLNCYNLRSIRGDNYCAIRASLYQALLNDYIHIQLGQDLQSITEVPAWFLRSGYTWINGWTFAHRLRRYNHPIVKMKECLQALQEQIDLMKPITSFEEREKRLLEAFNSEDSELDIQLLEAVKLLMLYNAVRLHEDNATGKEVPVFAWLMYARDTSETPEKWMMNHLNRVGDSGGLEQVEMFLLGFTLGVTLKVVRPSQFRQEDFVTHYPDDHVDDWPSITMIAEDDRHYNIAMQ